MDLNECDPLWVITAAGLGTRFRDAGFEEHKEAILMFGRPLAWWSLVGVCDLMRGSRVRIVTRRDGETDGWWAGVFAAVNLPAPEIIRLDHVTAGQAETVMCALGEVTDSKPLVVWNIDTLVRPGLPDATIGSSGSWILCFPSDQPNLSYAHVADDGTITAVREKVVISPWATAGLYGFDSVGLFKRAFEHTYRQGDDGGELYVAPMYDFVMTESPVLARTVGEGDVVPLGTPLEVAAAAKTGWILALAQTPLAAEWCDGAEVSSE